MVKIICDNILNSKEDVIATLVNCSGQKLDSITKKIYNKYNIDKEYYSIACKIKEPRKLLGKSLFMRTETNYIVSMFVKCSFKTQKESIHINSFIKCLEEIKQFCLSRDFTLALFLDIKIDYESRKWLIVQEILNEIFINMDIFLYVGGV